MPGYGAATQVAVLTAALALPPRAVASVGRGDGLVAVGPAQGRQRRSSTAVVEDIERRVVQAGGNVEGIIVASLAWSTPDDLDLHVVVPGGAEVNFQHRKADGGELDVDMCVHGQRGGKCTEHPVENIVFADEAPSGHFKVYVQNFNFHPKFLSEAMQVSRMHEGGARPAKEEQALRLGRDRPVLFELLVRVEGNFRLFQGLCTPLAKTHAESNVVVFEFDYVPSAEAREDRLVSTFEAEKDPTCAAHQQKLLDAGPRVPKPAESGTQPERREGSKPATSSRSSSGTKGRRARAKEDNKNAALQAVRSSSRDALLSKPNSALQSLLRDLEVACKGCLEKGELVDKLLETAGVGHRSGEL